MSTMKAISGVNYVPAGTRLEISPLPGFCARYRTDSGPPGYVPSAWTWVPPGETAVLGGQTANARWEVGYLPARAYPATNTAAPTGGLTKAIERLTARVHSARVVAAALNERTQLLKEKEASMGLHEKMKNLADRAKHVPRRLGDKADSLFARFDQIEKRGDEAFGRMHGVLDDMERGVAETEDALNQLTNGAPLGGGSAMPS